MFDLGPWHPRFKFDNNLLNKHFLQLVFFSKVQSILSRENCRGGGGLLFQVGRWRRWILKLLKLVD